MLTFPHTHTHTHTHTHKHTLKKKMKKNTQISSFQNRTDSVLLFLLKLWKVCTNWLLEEIDYLTLALHKINQE